MNDNFKRVKNQYEHLHPVNATAERAFGLLCADHYNEIKKANPGYKYELAERCFKRAIEFGLTHEMSTSGEPIAKLERIWGIVEKEMEAQP